jgi:hypothetical protein
MVEERTFTQGPVYHIRVRGSLDSKWTDWFAGFVMASRPSGETVLSGTEVDQAGLYGVLSKLHSLGLPVMLVVQTACPCPEMACPRYGQCGPCADFRDGGGQLPYCFRPGTEWERTVAQLTSMRGKEKE